jgi:hypothetical protein
MLAAYKGEITDNTFSVKVVGGLNEELRARLGVAILPGFPTLCSKEDNILLTSVDGQTHLKGTRQVFACGKPVWIEKPLAATLEDARETALLGWEVEVKWRRCSSEA